MTGKAVQTAFPTMTSSCLTPFLYQTRTLLQHSRIPRPFINLQQACIPQRTISIVPALRGGSIPSTEAVENPPKTTYQTHSAAHRSNLPDRASSPIRKYETIRPSSIPIRRVADASSAGVTSRKDKVADWGTLRSSTRRGRQQKARDNASFGHMTQSIDFEQEADEMWHGGKDEISDLARSQPLGDSTITDSERYAFQRVFKDIFGRTQNQDATIRDAYGLTTTSTPSTATGAESTTKFSRWELEEMINRYPAPLRAAAARAMGLGQVEVDGEEETIDVESKLDLERLEALREPERQRVETLMKEASSDVELWDIMDKEVFSLVAKLGLGDVGERPSLSKTKPKKKKKKGEEEAGILTEEPDRARPATNSLETFAVDDTGLSPLALYGPLYPAYLLLGIRLLDRYFSKSSSLTLAILPKIKSLGVISHVLGASSQLYNELIQIYRYRHDNYRGILGLLEEMEHGGIEFDQETLDIVKDIERTQASVRRGEKGEVLQLLWNFPEFAPNKFKVWNEKITADLRKKELSRRVTVTY